MFRHQIVALFVLSAVICCMGQTFQYSRGWTNGKRSNPHLHEDSLLPAMIEADVQRKLEKCLLSLQRMAQSPLGFRLQPMMVGRINENHQSGEIIDDFGGDQPNGLKGQNKGYN